MAAEINIEIFKGQDVILPFQQVVEGTSTPVDITGWTIYLTIKLIATSSTTLLTATASNTNPAQGQYQFHLTHAQTVALAANVYEYDIQRADAGGETPMSIGTFTVKQEVLYK